MNICQLCQKKEIKDLLNFGSQPICNRFLKSSTEEEYVHSLRLGQCAGCGLVQIISPVSAEELKPIYDWIIYTEPENHIGDLVRMIIDLPEVTKESVVCGVSFKDDSTLNLMKARGFKNVWRIDPQDDLEIKDRRAGLETLQARFSPQVVKKILKRRCRPDIVVARHCLEHCNCAIKFMQALKELVKPNGYVVIEVPDCQRAIEKQDFTTIWEEHIFYFTSATFKQCFSFVGFNLIRFEKFFYPLEDSLVGIAQAVKKVAPIPAADGVLEDEKRKMLAYSEGLSIQRKKLESFFTDYRKNKGKIAMLGAGHLSCAFINLLELKDLIEFIIDDNPRKQGLFMPGSRIPIYGNLALIKENIKLCLLGLAPDKEEKIIQNNQDFLEHGGEFRSIFPGSSRFLDIRQ